MQGTNLLGGMSPFFTESHLTQFEIYQRQEACVAEYQEFKSTVLTQYEIPINKKGSQIIPWDMFNYIANLDASDIQASDLNVFGFMHEVQIERSGSYNYPFNVVKVGAQEMRDIYGINMRFSIATIHKFMYMASFGSEIPKSLFVSHKLFDRMAEHCIMHCTSKSSDELHTLLKHPTVSLHEVKMYKEINGIYEL